MKRGKFLYALLILLFTTLGCGLFGSRPEASSITVVTFTPGPSPSPLPTIFSTMYPDIIDTPTSAAVIKPATSTPSVELESQKPNPLDLSDPESIAAWISYSLKNADPAPFSEIIIAETIAYGSGLGGMREELSRDAFLKLVTERIQSKPACVGYVADSTSVSIWTKGWSPVWTDKENGKSDELVIQIFWIGMNDQYVTAFFLPSSGVLKVIDTSKPCP